MAAMVSAIPLSSLRAAMMTVNGVVGDSTCSGGCLSRMREDARKATIAPGRYATRMTIVHARTVPVTGSSWRTQALEMHIDTATQTNVNPIAMVNLPAAET